MNNKIQRIIISRDSSILFALKRMDELGVKLLILESDQKFAGLISIGDIQRSIINKIPFENKVATIVRDSIYYASPEDDLIAIKKQMLLGRDECMPIVDKSGYLTDVIFWDDLFEKGDERNQVKLEIPVIIMAGGKGTRMKPLTNIIPKPLIPIGEKSIIEEIISRFNKLGADKFYVSVNYKAEMIKLHFDKIENKPYNLIFFEENMPSGTAGSLHLLSGKITSTFFVTNCDILVEQDYRDILSYHKENNNEITMVCSLKSVYIPYGTVITGDKGQLLSMQEKPEVTFMINTGMYILEPELLQLIPKDKVYHLTDLIEEVKSKKGRVGVFPISEKQYYDIGEWDYYKKTLEIYNLPPF